MCLGQIYATAVKRPASPFGLFYVRADTGDSDLLITDPNCIPGITGVDTRVHTLSDRAGVTWPWRRGEFSRPAQANSKTTQMTWRLVTPGEDGDRP